MRAAAGIAFAPKEANVRDAAIKAKGTKRIDSSPGGLKEWIAEGRPIDALHERTKSNSVPQRAGRRLPRAFLRRVYFGVTE